MNKEQDLQEYIYKNYGTKQLQQNDIQKVIRYAVDLNLIKELDINIVPPIGTSDLYNKIIECKKNKESLVTITTPLDSRLTDVQKVEKIMKTFLKYEETRRSKRTVNGWLVSIILSLIISIYLHRNYIREPF
ncbi:hypothetical protein A0H76_1072 [Hepatospora eriocheir]|uniref:Uncharacterized protein n=1 Tax=Hepatospora eriocheir TaxID=1081669 RepID=A0A1X0QKV6_9MICR|nr:hypothetical protein HERIO_1887 [Hepatospora eriocheir]ORE00403.1 hypothetical protein A0H76_1072 [Hepatospora eriocheir]